MNRNYDAITFISKYLYFTNRVGNFADIVKIASMYIKTTFKDSKKVIISSLKKKTQKYIKMQSIAVFLDITKVVGSW